MQDRPVNPWLRQALELGPPILFFIAYMRFQDVAGRSNGIDYDGFILVTAAFVRLLLASMAVLWKLTRQVLPHPGVHRRDGHVFGGLTRVVNDERFFKDEDDAGSYGLLRGDARHSGCCAGALAQGADGERCCRCRTAAG